MDQIVWKRQLKTCMFDEWVSSLIGSFGILPTDFGVDRRALNQTLKLVLNFRPLGLSKSLWNCSLSKWISIKRDHSRYVWSTEMNDAWEKRSTDHLQQISGKLSDEIIILINWLSLRCYFIVFSSKVFFGNLISLSFSETSYLFYTNRTSNRN